MLQSKRNKPCFYMETEADVTDLMAYRPRLRKSLGIKITTNTFYIHALALGVEKYPLIAGRLSGDQIEIADHVNIGFAVNAPQGLVVPVINLGIYGIDAFFGIIPPPASVILCVGNIIRKFLPIEGKPEVRRTVSLSLAIDGKEITEPYAARFLMFIKDHLQNPQRLIEE